jgi:hypothetical protein
MPDAYTGTEKACELEDVASEEGAVFEVRPPKIPAEAVPVYDDVLNAVVGYRYESTGGVYRLLDLDGNIVGIEEKGLETPLIDPIDLLFFMGGIFRGIGKGAVTGVARTASKVVATGAARVTTKRLVAVVVSSMRTVFKRLSVQSLKFTETTAARMATRGRYVPVHILHLALKYGKRVADPQGVKGAFLYTINLVKNGEEYALEIVVREKDWTILHFLYK